MTNWEKYITRKNVFPLLFLYLGIPPNFEEKKQTKKSSNLICIFPFFPSLSIQDPMPMMNTSASPSDDESEISNWTTLEQNNNVLNLKTTSTTTNDNKLQWQKLQMTYQKNTLQQRKRKTSTSSKSLSIQFGGNNDDDDDKSFFFLAPKKMERKRKSRDACYLAISLFFSFHLKSVHATRTLYFLSLSLSLSLLSLSLFTLFLSLSLLLSPLSLSLSLVCPLSV